MAARTHKVVGRGHAGPGRASRGLPFYDPCATQQLVQRELGITSVPFKHAPELNEFVTEGEVEKGVQAVTLSGTELRARLARGEAAPEWFTFPEVPDESQQRLNRPHPAVLRSFLRVYSVTPKSTIANVLLAQILENSVRRAVTLLDGAVVRQTLSSEFRFSRDHRQSEYPPHRVRALPPTLDEFLERKRVP